MTDAADELRCPIDGVNSDIVTDRMLAIMNVVDQDWGLDSFAALVMAVAAIAMRQENPVGSMKNFVDFVHQAMGVQ